MNCRDAGRLIDTFFDGELDGRVMRDAALHITRCPSCEGELQDRERLQQLLAESIGADIDRIDLGAIWVGVARALDGATSERAGARVVALRSGPRSVADSSAGGFPSREAAATLHPAQTAEETSDPLGTADSMDAVFGVAGASGRIDWDAADTGLWDDPRSRWRWSSSRVSLALGGAAALAASVILAVTLAGRDSVLTLSTPTGDSPVSTLAGAGHDASSNQVRIESMDSPSGSVAMWSEPEDDTMVIWIDDDDPAIQVTPAAVTPGGQGAPRGVPRGVH